jgi:AraC family transcriptional regulator
MSFSSITYALVNYVECHLEDMNLKKMAESFGFSEIYLRELFYKNVNIPIMQYYKRRRMIASAFELLHSDKTILMIALESGFSNPESYTRAFKKIFGMTPSRFRIERPLMVRKQLEAGVFGLESGGVGFKQY